MEPARRNLRIVRGDDFLKKYRFTSEDPLTAVRTPIDLTGWGVESKVTGMRDRADYVVTTTIFDAPDGVVQLSIPSAVTALFPTLNADWYLSLINPSLLKVSYMAGDVYFLTNGDSV